MRQHRKNRSIIVGLLIAGLIISSTTVYAATETIRAVVYQAQLEINGKVNPLANKDTLLNYKGQTYVPLRFIVERLGGRVEFEPESSIKQAKIKVATLETKKSKNSLIMTKKLLSIARLGKLDGIDLPLGATKEDILNALGEPDQQGEEHSIFLKYGKTTFYLDEDILITIGVENDLSATQIKSILGPPDMDGLSDAGTTEYVLGYETGSYYLFFAYPLADSPTGRILFKNPR